MEPPKENLYTYTFFFDDLDGIFPWFENLTVEEVEKKLNKKQKPHQVTDRAIEPSAA